MTLSDGKMPEFKLTANGEAANNPVTLYFIPTIPIKVFEHGKGCEPEPLDGGQVAFQLRATQETVIPSGGARSVEFGFAIAIPLGFEGQIRTRSVSANFLRVAGGVRTIDNLNQRELSVLMENNGVHPIRIARGEPVAQLVVSPVAYPVLQVVEEFTIDDSYSIALFASPMRASGDNT